MRSMSRRKRWRLLWPWLVVGCLLTGQVWAADVSIHAEQAPLRQTLSGLARLGGYNIVMTENVKGKVTLHVDEVSAEEAMRLVAQAADLGVEQRGKTWIFYGAPTAETSGKESTTIPLQYLSAKEAKDNLQTILPAEHIEINRGANAVVLTGTPRELNLARRLMNDLDKAYLQVKVEVEVIAVNRDSMKELGIDWDWQSLTGSANYTRESWTERIPQRDSAGNLVYNKQGHVRYQTIEHSGERVSIPDGFGSIQFGRKVTGHPYSFFFRAQLQALVAQGRAEILAKPNIMTLNGHEARILIGNKIPVLVDHLNNGETVTTTEYRDAGIQLLYTPRINQNREITAEVHAEVSTPYLVPEMRAYRIVTREATTTVRLQEGETLAIGGLIDREVMSSLRKVPFLGDIPLLGKLFQSKKKQVSEAEILILIRAEIVK